MELGKDIITVGPDGVPCAYQLKGVDGGRLTLSRFRDDLERQLPSLVNTKINHPSVDTKRHHRAFIVINGDLDEEVQTSIDLFNRSQEDAGFTDRKVQTIVKGQLFGYFKELQSDFWATNLTDVKTYLELILAEGNEQLPREDLCSLFDDALPLDVGERPSDNKCLRSLAGCAVTCASAISSFTNRGNHLAEFEAWTLFWSYSMGLATRWNLPNRLIRFAIETSSQAMFTSLGRLCDELMERDGFIEGDIVADSPLYHVRMTHLLGLVGLYGLWLQENIRQGTPSPIGHLEFAVRFTLEQQPNMQLWGEYCIPQVLAWFFFRQSVEVSPKHDRLLSDLVALLSRSNHPNSEHCLPNPYYDPETWMPYSLGLATKPIRDSFQGRSYYLEPLVHLLARCNRRVEMAGLFPDVTRIAHSHYQPEEQWHFCRYNNGDKGILHDQFLVPPHSWKELQAAAGESEGLDLPTRIRQYPRHALALLMVMPHRASSSFVRWLATQMDDAASDKSWVY